MKSPGHSVIRIGAWRVDPAIDEISRDGQSVKLEPKLMRLLMCLAARAGEVVSVEELLDEVWKGVVVTQDSVYHAVAALRRVLGDDTKEPSYIVNVLRRGYRLVAPVAPWTVSPEPQAAHPVSPAQSAPLPVAATGSRDRTLHIVLMIALAAMIGIGYFAFDKFWVSKHQEVAAWAHMAVIAVGTSNSVAVLPFVDMSERKDQEFFGDGLSEELIYQLSRAPRLYVPARTSSFYFKGRQTTIPEIGKALGVRHVLEGSVRKSGNTLRVTAQLIRVDDGQHVWSDTFERQFTDVFKLQDEIANAVAQALRVSLLGENVPRAATVKDTEAYTLWLQARFFDYQIFNKESELKAVEYYRQVVRLDPTFASGWEGLSRAVAELPLFGAMPWQRGRDEALHAAERALAIDAKLPAAHIALGKVRYIFDFDWPAAQREFDAARGLDTHDSYALFWAGQLAATLGHDDDALQLYNEGILQDPLNSFLYQQIAATYYRQGRITDSVTAARRAVELSPTGAGGHVLLGQALLAAGARDAALEEIERESDDGLREWARARTYWLLGQPDRSDSALKRLETGFTENMAYRIAALYALRGNADQAFYWLERAFDQRNVGLTVYGGLIHDPDFEKLRHDHRYREFLRKMELPN